MPGGLMNLILCATQDVYTTSTPKIELFEVMYRRHLNFAELQNEFVKFADTYTNEDADVIVIAIDTIII